MGRRRRLQQLVIALLDHHLPLLIELRQVILAPLRNSAAPAVAAVVDALVNPYRLKPHIVRH